MSIASTLLAAGFSALLGTNGEPLHFRDAIVTGVVNRDPFAKVVRTPDFDPRDNCAIRIRSGDVSSVPRVGEEFVDAAGMAHRVEKIKRLGEWYDCECKTSEPLYALLTQEDGIQLATAGGTLLQAA